ncbi:MAG: RNA polymerase sigma factor [Candidatus Marinimicrobia bacterium]|nr:RNA polymerase sigma factor [Candidatus Neomarinimicrobiota bacterium]
MTRQISESYQKEHPKLLAYIRSKVRRLEDAEDIAQDVFYQTLTSVNALEPIEDLAAWIYTLARNRIIDWYRKKKPLELSPDDALGIESLFEIGDLEVLDVPTRELIYESIMDAIEELPLEQRTVFILQAIEGLTFREIAVIEDVSVNTLIARKRYAVAFLRKRLRSIKKIIENE